MSATHPWSHIVITGASSGFGAEFARQLAPTAKTLILTARRADLLQSLADSLQSAHPGLTVHCLPCDLASESDRAALPARCTALGITPDCLINNAGLGEYGTFEDAEWSKLHQVLAVNITALTHLIHLFIPLLKTHPASAILNVSSLAGETPIPDFAVYASSKAYVTRLGEALRIELRPLGIRLTTLCPGPSPTQFGQTAQRPGQHLPTATFARKSPAHVVATGLRALAAGHADAFPGFIVWTSSRLLKLLPTPLLRLILSRRPRKARPINP
ncbi:MAG: short-chain dehydrogenase/reductase [Verrucomicrobiales bacterium]|nr:short-chain dehydrogenase/reductase [Verrucomicrobiales bacterium]